MKLRLLFILLLSQLTNTFSQKNKPGETKAYFPTYSEWKQQQPAVAFDTTLLAECIRFAIASESKQPRSMELSQAMTFGKEPFGEGIGPFADRGEPTGIIIHN